MVFPWLGHRRCPTTPPSRHGRRRRGPASPPSVALRTAWSEGWGHFWERHFFEGKKNQGGNPRFLVIVFFFKVKLLKRQSLFRENANFSMGLLGIWVSTDRARREKWRARCNL